MSKVPRVAIISDVLPASSASLIRGFVKYAKLHEPWFFYASIPHYRLPYYQKNVSKHPSLSELLEVEIDGLLLHTDNARLIRDIISIGLPTIIKGMDRPISGLPNIISDNRAIGEMAAKYFLEHGFRNLGFCGYTDRPWSLERSLAFAETVEKAGYEAVIYKQLKTKLSPIAEQKHIANWLTSQHKPFAVFACDDDRGENILEICRIVGLRVPYDIAVLGVDNDEIICEMSNPSLSSISRNFMKAGYEAGELLHKLMLGKKMSGQKVTISPTEVVTRQSTDLVAVEDPEITAAILYIREQTRKREISVDDVADAMALGRRVLEKRFRKLFNHSVKATIRHYRVEHFARLLSETNLSVSTIASMMGFTEIKNVAYYFNKEKGMTPQAYRKQIHNM